MNMSFGKYKDKSVAYILFNDLGYFRWMESQGMESKAEYKFAMGLLNKLDSMPFANVKCMGECDNNLVSRISFYIGNPSAAQYYCENCDPYRSGANLGKLYFVKKVKDIPKGKEQNKMFQVYSTAKGIPKRKTENTLADFFGY